MQKEKKLGYQLKIKRRRTTTTKGTIRRRHRKKYTRGRRGKILAEE